MHRLVPRYGYPNSAELLRKSRALSANSKTLAVNRSSRYVSNKAARESTHYDVVEITPHWKQEQVLCFISNVCFFVVLTSVLSLFFLLFCLELRWR